MGKAATVMACALTACSIGGGGSAPCTAAVADVPISVDGIEFKARSQGAMVYAQNAEGTVLAVQVNLGAATNVCQENETARLGPTPVEQLGLELFINEAHSGTVPIVPWGDTSSNVFNWVYVFERPAGTPSNTLGMGKRKDATAGTVTFTKLATDRVAGSYDVMFRTGEHLAGSFDAPLCRCME